MACARRWGGERSFAAITFHNDVAPPADAVVAAARNFSKAPLILFENPSIECDEEQFDLVVRIPTPPEVWWGSFQEIVMRSRRLQEYSQQLRQECADARTVSRGLRETSARNRLNRFDYDALYSEAADGRPRDPDGGAGGS